VSRPLPALAAFIAFLALCIPKFRNPHSEISERSKLLAPAKRNERNKPNERN
jgi:hypothetical protein